LKKIAKNGVWPAFFANPPLRVGWPKIDAKDGVFTVFIMNQMFTDLDLKPGEDKRHKNEVESLNDFLHYKANDTAGYVTIYIGGTTNIINHLQHGSDYIKAADKALYESKHNGRNRYTAGKFGFRQK
jgi:hypothetical protein